MPEHLIRLRGPWELRVSTASRVGDASVRVVLPAAALPEGPYPITLRRQFGRPLRSSESVSCHLRCESVPGLLAIRLNGDPLLVRSPEGSLPDDPIELPIPGPLRLRNQVEFTVLGGAARFASPETPWGSVVLVFRENTEPPSC